MSWSATHSCPSTVRLFAFVLIGVLSPWAIKAAPPQPPIVTSGEWVLGDFDGDELVDEASIDWITFDVTARTTINFDALVFESAFLQIDLNGDGELTRADAGMVLFDEDGNTLVLHDDAPSGVFGEDGSVSITDGNFDCTFDAAGTYTLAISANGFWLTAADAVAGYIDYRIVGPAFRNELGEAIDHADWQVTLTVGRGSVSNVRVDTLGTPATPNPAQASACTYLWPPNGELVAITDVPQDADRIRVYSNEATGDLGPDAVLDEAGGLWLRAERAGEGFGRVYLIVAEFADEIDCCTVVVPHDKSAASMELIEMEAALVELEWVEYGSPPDDYVPVGP